MDISIAVEQAKTIEELLPIAEQAHAGLSCWSGKYAEVKGYEGFLDIDKLADRAMRLSERPKSSSPEISQHITRIYNEGDRLYKMSCFITKIFLFIHQEFLDIFCCGCIKRDDIVNKRAQWEGRHEMNGGMIY